MEFKQVLWKSIQNGLRILRVMVYYHMIPSKYERAGLHMFSVESDNPEQTFSTSK